MLILGIETSCDETAVAVLEEKRGNLKVLSNVVSSQVKIHRAWGGVVPNLAAREHLKNIIPVLKKSLKKARVGPEKIDLIAETEGPGLIPALLIGNMAAKTLSWLWKKPLIGIHHIEGHIYANFIRNEVGANTKSQAPNSKQIQNSKLENSKQTPIRFPLLCLVVSGGHTQLVFMENHLEYEIVGETLDDAAGEAFDKVARILGLGYPGGPEIAKRATHNVERGTVRDPRSTVRDLSLPRPMINSKNFNFSFSGLKTAVLYETKKHPRLLKNKNYIAEVCHEFQQAVIDVLVFKTLSAARKYHPKTISIAGGVSANKELRYQLGQAIEKNFPDIKYQIPDFAYSLDNASMIAAAGYFRWKKSQSKTKFRDNWKKITADANLKLKK